MNLNNCILKHPILRKKALEETPKLNIKCKKIKIHTKINLKGKTMALLKGLETKALEKYSKWMVKIVKK